MGRKVPGGILIGDAALYDALSHRFLLGSLFRRIAADIASVSPQGAKVLEVGCGPGRLSILLARDHGLEVTGLDLDPAMIERAKANARHSVNDGDRPSFLVGDVSSMAFPDGSFDLVVSTLSMHHWAEPSAGLDEIARVLRPGGRALVWDFLGGRIPLTGASQTRSTAREAPRFASRARPRGGGRAGSRSSDGSSLSALVLRPSGRERRTTPIGRAAAGPTTRHSET
jgi:ubiquinone/menaquinone biosynthesis C-methylase UbiE